MIRTLEIYEVISTTEADKRRALLKKQVRGVATATRLLAAGLRRRMNELAAKSGEGERSREVLGSSERESALTVATTATSERPARAKVSPISRTGKQESRAGEEKGPINLDERVSALPDNSLGYLETEAAAK